MLVMKMSQLISIICFSFIALPYAHSDFPDPTSKYGDYETRMASANHNELKVLTFNTWLLDLAVLDPFDAKDLVLRGTLMPQVFEETGAHVIFLQEVWRKNHREFMCREAQKINYFCLNILRPKLGNGLLILSKYKFVPGSEGFKEFSDEPYSLGWTRSDEPAWLVRKGIVTVSIEHPILGVVELYNAHAGAVTFDAELGHRNPSQDQVNLGQVAKFADYVREKHDPKNLAIIGADINTHFEVIKNNQYTGELTPQYSLLTGSSTVTIPKEVYWDDQKEDHQVVGLGFTDTYGIRYPQSITPKSPGEALIPKDVGITFDTKDNEYVTGGFFKGEPSERIDYILVSPDKRVSVFDSEVIFTPGQVEVFSERYLGTGLIKLLSDHYGVLTTLRINPSIE